MLLLQFGTTFEEMDALSGRRQTTKGIWLAAAGKVAAPRTLLLDLEGSDGRERGEDDNSFERQSSLFALAVADCLLVNMWAKDVGREAGAGKPLLKTIFQARALAPASLCATPGKYWLRRRPMHACASRMHAGLQLVVPRSVPSHMQRES